MKRRAQIGTQVPAVASPQAGEPHTASVFAGTWAGEDEGGDSTAFPDALDSSLEVRIDLPPGVEVRVDGPRAGVLGGSGGTWEVPDGFRAGIVALLGRPNAGKSTLVNALVRAPVAITSPRPQTTRGRIFGIRTTPEHQLVFADTPGFHRATGIFGTAMVGVAKEESRGGDAVLYVADLATLPGQEDEDIARFLTKHSEHLPPVILVGNKSDKVEELAWGERLAAYRALFPFAAEHVVSAVTGSGVPALEQALADLMPSSPMLFPPDMFTDQEPRAQAAEVVREKVLVLTRHEIPHSVAVEMDELRPGRSEGTLYMRGTIYVERESQKGIVVGREGRLLKKIGSLARLDLQARFGQKVFIELWVKVKEDWRSRKDVLRAWGFNV